MLSCLCSILNCLWDWVKSIDIGDMAAVVACVISVVVYKHTVSREARTETIRQLTLLRSKYPKVSWLTKKQKINYLRDMEFFCTGVNEGLYHLRIVKKMSGRRLLNQYNGGMKEFMLERRSGQSHPEDTYVEYEKVMEKLKCAYCCNCCLWKRIFRRKSR